MLINFSVVCYIVYKAFAAFTVCIYLQNALIFCLIIYQAFDLRVFLVCDSSLAFIW